MSVIRHYQGWTIVSTVNFKSSAKEILYYFQYKRPSKVQLSAKQVEAGFPARPGIHSARPQLSREISPGNVTDLALAASDGIEQILLGVVDACLHSGEALRVRRPQHHDLVKIVRNLEVPDVLPNLCRKREKGGTGKSSPVY